MSTKTLRKRIALVAVSALGAGLLSVVAVPSANAAGGLAIGTNGASGATAGTLGVGAKSSGLLGTVSGSGTTQTATLLSTGALGISVGTSTTSSKYAVVVVTGGTISSADGTDAMNEGQTLAGCLGDAACGVVVKPNSGVATMTVQVYDDAAAAGAGLSTSGGTLTGQVVVTIAATSTAGAYSAAKSKVNTTKYTGATSVSATVDGVDQTDYTTGVVGLVSNGDRGYFNFQLNDAYGVALADTGAIVIQASGGGLVGFSSTLGTSIASASLVNIAAVTNSNEGTVTVGQSVANAPLTTTVTVTYNGVVVATKTFTFRGEVAKVEAYNTIVAKAGTSTTSAFRVKYFDANGTRLYPSTDTSATTVVSTTLNQYVTAASVATTGDESTATAAKGSVTCGGTAASGAGVGSADLQLQFVNASGTIVKSNTWKQACGGNALTYTAAFDKATYAPGSIATLTIKFLDGKGNLTHNQAGNIASTSADEKIVVTGAPNASVAIYAPTTADVAGAIGVDAPGTITFQYIVGSTEGDFVAVVEVPTVDANGYSSKQTVNYSVKATSTGVSNADVLKAIVSLIASINKQIAALQKALLKKK